MDDMHRVGATLDLAAIDPSATPGFSGSKKDGHAALRDGAPELENLQERLFAESRLGSEQRVLLVIQAMDTAGKGGILDHVIGLMSPQGVRIHSFKAPTEEEKKHDFLWRIRAQLPEAGYIGVFDRSHYEDVLIHRVRGFSSPEVIEERYGLIEKFENELVAAGTTIVKVMLHISPEEQKERLEARLDDPTKHWKYNPGDVDERGHWPAYMEAYEIALTRTSTERAPWYVIPANHKWYARLAVERLLTEALRAIDPQWPTADYDVEAERKRLRSVP
jgi:PPK2 family polyphosphate:nucleotide phosphotransferase